MIFPPKMKMSIYKPTGEQVEALQGRPRYFGKIIDTISKCFWTGLAFVWMIWENHQSRIIPYVFWLNSALFFWNDFGRIVFWRVRWRPMSFSRKFSLLNRYFCTTLLYQFFFLDQIKWSTISSIPHNSLRILAKMGKKWNSNELSYFPYWLEQTNKFMSNF